MRGRTGDLVCAVGGSRRASSSRPTIAALVVAVAALAAGACSGGDDPSTVDAEGGAGGNRTLTVPDAAGALPLRPIPGLRQRVVGRGPTAAALVWEGSEDPSRNAIVFVHAWGRLPAMPFAYRGWIRHLTKREITVVFPIYQDVTTTPGEAAENAFQGIAAGLDEIDARRDTLVVAGHTTGGALAFDYAASAADLGGPRPRGVLAVYPGRNPGEERIEPADLSRIASGTRVAVVTGPGNPVVEGGRQARRLLTAVDHVPSALRRRHVARDERPDGPFRDDAAARRAFWRPLDGLIAQVRRETGE